MKRVCLTVLCILLVGCGNAETAETEEKMRFENLDPAKVNMQYGGLKEWDRFYNSFYEQKEGSDLIVDRKSTRLNSSHYQQSRMPSSA